MAVYYWQVDKNFFEIYNPNTGDYEYLDFKAGDLVPEYMDSRDIDYYLSRGEIGTEKPKPKYDVEMEYLGDDLEVLLNGNVWQREEVYDENTGNYVLGGYQSKELELPFEITINVINDELMFEDDIYFNFYDENTGNYVYFYYRGSTLSKSLLMNEDNIKDGLTDYTPKFTDVGQNGKTGISLISKPQEGTSNFPYVKIYDIDGNNLNKLPPFSYKLEESTDGYVEYYEEKNYGKYITGLFSFPYAIIDGSENIEPILLGGEETFSEGFQVLNHIKKVDLGTIIIPQSNYNVGYSNITVDLFVPRFDKITLETDRVINSILEIFINLNLLTGKGTLNIKSLKSDSIIATQQTQIGVKIPYAIDSIDTSLGSDVLLTDYDTPYVEIKTLTPDNEIQFSSINRIKIDDSYDLIKDDEDILLHTSATEREQKMLKDSIRSGIFIRK